MNPLATIQGLRETIARLEKIAHQPSDIASFGIETLDEHLPGGGLAISALHEVSGSMIGLEFATAPALFAAGILARLQGPVLWVLQERDLFAPALAAAGLHPSRVIYAEAGHHDALAVMEEGLRQPGLAGVVGEVSARVSLSASRKLHLAAQAGQCMAFLLRRRAAAEGALAAVTRWRIRPAQSAPPVPHAPSVAGLARPLWELELTRCRGGRTGVWIVESCDAQGRLGLVSPLADRPAAAPPRRIVA